ncbi:helix-turn-helix domain-containing protein [Streptomyces sp. SBC-4]|nr:helix-turn-helix domain-containing protein [Streptomyces sp. SBC-4]MDV5145872.1 helix-turn-helix domain-containing protein [Streptomyces sp. SBC-4]
MTNTADTYLSREVLVSPPLPSRRLVNPELLRLIMRRTGTGARLSIRQLAEIVDIPHQAVGRLLTGEQTDMDGTTALAIASAVGVDLDVLWIPIQRAGVRQLGQTVEPETAAAA